MAVRPTLHIAVAKTKSKASEYNDNFDLMMQFVDDSIDEAKNYIEGYMPSVTGQSGKFLTNNGTVASWGNIDLSGKADTDLANTTPAASFITKSTNWVMPASSGTNKSLSTTYTAGSDGYIVFYSTVGSSGYGIDASLYVNGNVIQRVANNVAGAGSTWAVSFFAPVAKGDTYKITSTVSAAYYKFITCKGGS